MRMWAIVIHASALAIVFSQSFANLRHRFSHAKVRSTTQRRGMTSKPLAVSERLTISIVQSPILSSSLSDLAYSALVTIERTSCCTELCHSFTVVCEGYEQPFGFNFVDATQREPGESED